MTASNNVYSDFTEADQATIPKTMYRFLDLVNASPEFQYYKRQMRPLLALQPGETVLFVHAVYDGIRHGQIESQLPRLISDAGLVDVAFQGRAIQFTHSFSTNFWPVISTGPRRRAASRELSWLSGGSP